MAHSSLEKAAADTPLDVIWKAFELRPEEAAPLPEAELAEMRGKIEAGWPRVEAIAQEQYGLTMRRGPWGVNTRLAHRGAKAAGLAGKGSAYHLAVFQAYWERQEDISDPAVLAAIAVAVDLEEAAFRSGLASEASLAAVLADQSEAYQLGLEGVPAMVFERKYLLPGAIPPAQLRRVVAQVRT